MPGKERPQSLSLSSARILFSTLAIASVVIWWRSLAATIDLASHDEKYTHIFLILPISAALIFLDWKSHEPSDGLSIRIGSPLLAMAALVAALVRWRALPLASDVQLSVNMLAFVGWWIAAFILCFGTRTFRVLLFPLCFLFSIVPLPQFVFKPIVSLLQQGSAAAANLLFATAGVPVAQDGVLLHIPGLTVEVAKECSSIRSSLLLVVTTTVLAQLLLRSLWRKSLAVAVAIPLSVAKNGLRIFVIAMLATRVDRSFLTGRLHRQGGVVFFLIALAAIFLLLAMLRHGDTRTTGSDAQKRSLKADPYCETQL
jgi:exosortase